MVTRFGLLNTSFDTETVTGLAATLFSRTVPVARDRKATFVGAIDALDTTVAAVVVAPPPPPPPPPPLPLDASVVAGARSSTAAIAITTFHVPPITTPFVRFVQCGPSSDALGRSRNRTLVLRPSAPCIPK